MGDFVFYTLCKGFYQMNVVIKDYTDKIEYLSALYQEVKAVEFYRELFPVGSFERLGFRADNKPNALALEIIQSKKGKAFHYVITDGLEQIPDLIAKDFIISSAISYLGERRTGDNARFIYALTFDIDAVGLAQLKDLLFQAKNKIIPMPTFTVVSGGGLHLYFQFKEPLPMFRHFQRYLRSLKHGLTKRLWNDYTSKREDIEYQSILQGFRMVGSPSKLGKQYPVRAFKTGDKIDIDYLYSFLLPEDKKNLAEFDTYKESHLSLEKAKELYPDWYNHRVEKQKKPRWHIKKDLYYWWLNRIENEIKYHHRYFAIMTLSIYARKCDIPEEQLRADAYGLLDKFDKLTEEERNHFTEDDIEAALVTYNERYITFPRDTISRLTNIPIKENKRNGRKQYIHLERIRHLQEFDYPNGEWRANNGRKSKKEEIKQYMITHKDCTKKDIKDDLGISYPTIRKFYDIIKSEIGDKQDGK